MSDYTVFTRPLDEDASMGCFANGDGTYIVEFFDGPIIDLGPEDYQVIYD